MNALNTLLMNKGVCQTGNEDDSDVDINGLIYGNITDLLPLLAKVLRDGFVPAYKIIHKSFRKFLDPKKGVDDISQAVGTLANCAKYSPLLVQTFYEDLLPAMVKCLDLNEEIVNRNTAYALGKFCEVGKETIAPYYQDIMKALKQIFDTATLEDTKDNAVAAIARMTYTQPAKMPLNLVVPTIMGALPFKGDVQENKAAVKMIIFLLEQSNFCEFIISSLKLFLLDAQALNGYEEKAITVLIDAVVNWSKYKLKEKYIKACGVTLKALGNSNEQIKKIIEVI